MIDAPLGKFDNAKRRRDECHPRQSMLTPAYILEPIRHLLGGNIGLDPCTEPDNPTLAEAWISLPEDGCTASWDYNSVFCNPPYGEARDRWVERCIVEGHKRPVVLLIPSHTDTRTFQRAATACTSVLLIRGRLKFGALRPKGREQGGRIQEAASHGSAVFGFGIDVSPLRDFGVPMSLCPQFDLALQADAETEQNNG